MNHCIAFFEGGRLTFDDIHYVREGDNLIPAGETPFAKDPHFGYSSSNMIDWVVEKGKGEIARGNVTSIGLQDIREGGLMSIANILERQYGNTITVNGEWLFVGLFVYLFVFCVHLTSVICFLSCVVL